MTTNQKSQVTSMTALIDFQSVVQPYVQGLECNQYPKNKFEKHSENLENYCSIPLYKKYKKVWVFERKLKKQEVTQVYCSSRKSYLMLFTWCSFPLSGHKLVDISCTTKTIWSHNILTKFVFSFSNCCIFSTYDTL